MTTAWVVRQGRGGQFAYEMIRAEYLGMDFIGDYDIRPHLGGGAEVFNDNTPHNRPDGLAALIGSAKND